MPCLWWLGGTAAKPETAVLNHESTSVSVKQLDIFNWTSGHFQNIIKCKAADFPEVNQWLWLHAESLTYICVFSCPHA